MKNVTLFCQKQKTILMIFVFFIFTAIMQANPTFFYSSHEQKTTLFVLTGLCYFALLLTLYVNGRLSEENMVFMIILAGVILRSFYVIFTGINDRQHDEGTFSSLSDSYINAGHLGYIEYFCKFKHLPDFSPYELFSYYHPPLHHIISALFIGLQILWNVPEKLAFENIQALTFLYSSLCLPITYEIFKKLRFHGKSMMLALAFITLHPGMIFMSGSVNNDMLATMLTFLCFYFAINWMDRKSLKNLIKIAFCLGFGMISKLNTAVMAFPLAAVFLYDIVCRLFPAAPSCPESSGRLNHFKTTIKQCRTTQAILLIRNYAVFLLITAGIGLSFVIRNLIFYHTNPGVPVLTEESILYIGRFSFADIFGIPTNYLMEYPFHTINGSQICNSWLILFRTSIFAEVRPGNLSDFLMVLCRAALVLAMVCGILFAVMTLLEQVHEIRKGNRELGIFLLTGYIAVIITFIAFIIKYPYTCSCDFRYVVISILFTSITICQLNRYASKNGFWRMFRLLLNGGIALLTTLTTFILLFWDQW